MNSNALSDSLLHKLAEDCTTHGVTPVPDIEVMLIYGSRARGTARADSDLDAMLFATTLSKPEPLVFHGRILLDQQRIPLEYRVFSLDNWQTQMQAYPPFVWRVIAEAKRVLDRGSGEALQRTAQEHVENALSELAQSVKAADSRKILELTRYFFQEARADALTNFKSGHVAAAFARILQFLPWFYGETLKLLLSCQLQDAGDNPLDAHLMKQLEHLDQMLALQRHTFRGVSPHKFSFAPWYTELCHQADQLLTYPSEIAIRQFFDRAAQTFQRETLFAIEVEPNYFEIAYG